MKIVISILALLSLTHYSLAQETQIRKKHFNLKKSVAIQGYDPVSYFDGVPQKGSKEYKTLHNGVIYYFANKENAETFNKSPEQYEPEYGGWCAYAVGATGEKIKIDPKTFKIIDNKLYLFYNFGNTNTLQSWNENEANLINKADANWSKIIN